jgi:hypothetical protein
MSIIKKTSVGHFLDDAETLSKWLVDFLERAARAEICQHSSVGLSYERQDELLHEGRALRRALEHLVKRRERDRQERDGDE